jgi:hypothetical protein
MAIMQQGPRQPMTQLPADGGRPKRLAFRMHDEHYGRGYAAAFFVFFGAWIAASVCIVRSSTDAGRVRSAAALFAVMGGGFAFALVYQVVQGIGFPVSSAVGRRFGYTVLERSRTPIRWWIFVLAWLGMAAALLAFAAWLWVDTDAVAARLAPYRPNGG